VTTKEVSCKGLEAFFGLLDRRGIRLEDVLGDFPMTAAELRDPSGWMAWNDFALLLERVQTACDLGDDIYRLVCEEYVRRAPSTAYLRKFARLFISPRGLYVFFCKHGGQLLFPVVRSQVEPLGNDRLRWTLSVPEGYADCPLFFVTGGENLKILAPLFLGQPPPTIEATFSHGKGVYDITLPPSTTLWFKIVRFLRVLLFSRAIVEEEFRLREEELLRNYDELNKSQQALKELNANLERLVEQKTEELMQRNREIVEEKVRTAYAAGMAEIASEIIHNVGNTLNSASVSLDVVCTELRDSKIARMRDAMTLMEQQRANRDAPAGDKEQKLLAYLDRLVGHVGDQHERARREAEHALEKTKAVSDIVSMQEAYARPAHRAVEDVSVQRIVDDLLGLEASSFKQARIAVRSAFAADSSARVDKLKFTRVLLKLFKFARAVACSGEDRALDIAVLAESGRVVVAIDVAGTALSAGEKATLFSADPALRAAKESDLHFCANAVIDMNGAIGVDDRPLGGTRLTVALPAGGAIAEDDRSKPRAA
jgi:signal transduction histidine kinase